MVSNSKNCVSDEQKLPEIYQKITYVILVLASLHSSEYFFEVTVLTLIWAAGGLYDLRNFEQV